MADSLILVQRNTPPEGSSTQSVDVLANHGTDYYLWTVQGILVSQTDAQVQTTLNGMVAAVITAILANNEVPLTAEQLAVYQNIIDLQQSEQWRTTLKADIDLINTATTDANALTGYKPAFSNAAFYNGLTNAARQELIRVTVNAVLGMLVDLCKSVRILLKRSERP